MFWNLVKKEMRLQRSNIYFAAAVFFIWSLGFLIVFLGDRPLGSKTITTGTLAQIIHYIFTLPCLIVIFPVMTGATSVAQERKLGTFDWQTTLPSSRRMRFTAKFGVPLFLSLIMGGMLMGIMDYLLVWNLRTHNILWSLGKRDFTPLPFRIKGLYPGIFALLLCAAGIYISSICKDPYKALISVFGFLALTIFTQRLIDPAGMLSLLGETFPDQYVHPLIHYSRFLFLSFFLIWLGFCNFHPQLRKIKTFLFQVLLWILLINITGYITLVWEFNPGFSSEPETTSMPGFSKLLELKNAHDHFSCQILCIPNSSRIVTSIFMEKDKPYFLEHRNDWSSGYIMEISIDTGRKRFIPGLFGYITEISPEGKYYAVEQSITKASYNVTPSGFVIPSGIYDKLGKIFGYSTAAPFFWQRSFYHYKRRERMVIKTTSRDISPEKRGKIISADGSTSYKIQEGNNVAILIHHSEIGINGDLMFTQKFAPNKHISLSPDERYLLYITIPFQSVEFHDESLSQDSPKELEFRILDLKTGNRTLLEKVPASILSEKHYEYLKQKKHPLSYKIRIISYDLSFIPCAWSNDFKLAVLYDENLYLYQYLPGEKRFIILGRVNMPAELYSDSEEHDSLTMEIWSEDILLILSRLKESDTLWKLDLRSCIMEKKS
ncbi:hypothetical protein JW926_11165 [Candidatus Sumerlaeota bacterium]|nr:hypothetical protein [Candidatus Sumerlaeota bacterium]